MKGGKARERKLPFRSLLIISHRWFISQLIPCSKLSRSPTPLETAPRKYNNAGLRQDLKTKKTEETLDPFQNGGLDDDHASSVHPNFPRARGLSRTYAFYGTPPEPEAKGLKRDHSRKNNVGTSVFLITWNISLTWDILARLRPTRLRVCRWIRTHGPGQNQDQVKGMNNNPLIFFNFQLTSLLRRLNRQLVELNVSLQPLLLRIVGSLDKSPTTFWMTIVGNASFYQRLLMPSTSLANLSWTGRSTLRHSLLPCKMFSICHSLI